MIMACKLLLRKWQMKRRVSQGSKIPGLLSRTTRQAAASSGSRLTQTVSKTFMITQLQLFDYYVHLSYVHLCTFKNFLPSCTLCSLRRIQRVQLNKKTLNIHRYTQFRMYIIIFSFLATRYQHTLLQKKKFSSLHLCATYICAWTIKYLFL